MGNMGNIRELIKRVMAKFCGPDGGVNLQGYSMEEPSERDYLLVMSLVKAEKIGEEHYVGMKHFRVTAGIAQILARKVSASWWGTTDEQTGAKSAVFLNWMNRRDYTDMLGIPPEEAEEGERFAEALGKVLYELEKRAKQS